MSHRVPTPRSPLLGLALAGAVALTPLPLGAGREASEPIPDLTLVRGAAPDADRPSVPLGRQLDALPDRPSVVPALPPAPESLEGYVWPLPRGRLTQPFGPTAEASRVVDGQPFHDGIDLATFCGDRVVAAHGGRVLAAGRRFDRVIGYVGDLERYLDRIERRKLWPLLPIVVVIDDGNGYRSMYAHFSRIVVKRGQTVGAGQLLGHEGATGNASGCHLHYGLFSPDESALMAIRPDVARRWKLPAFEIARIDPLRVLPERVSVPAPTGPSGPRLAVRPPVGSGVR